MKIGTFMTPFSKLIYGRSGISLSEANRILWEHKLNSLPIIDADDRLAYFVFRKDYDSHRKNPGRAIRRYEEAPGRRRHQHTRL